VPSFSSSSKTSAMAPASVADRKRQWSQLADMGIKVPEGVRAEMAMAGEWQTVARPHDGDALAGPSLSKGVRKRKLEGDDEDEEEKAIAGETVRRKGWGSATRRYPGGDAADIDDLLSGALKVKKEEPVTDDNGQSPLELKSQESTEVEGETGNEGSTTVVTEDTDVQSPPQLTPVVTEELTVPAFKKRKGKSKAS
jgi:hypothetical protein